MAKNKFMKIAAFVLMLCLLTTCAISTTFAKYTTQETASDSARVAKWGVRLTINGDDMLKNAYTNSSNAVTVQSSSTNEKVVAPGTSGSTIFSIVGTPEVTTDINIAFNVTEGVYLKAGTYKDTVTDKTFTIANDYCPVVFTLTQTHNRNGEMATPVVLATGTLTDIQTYLDAYSTSDDSTYDPNTNLASTFVLSWAWAYEVNNEKNVADTTLGNLMVNAGDYKVLTSVTTTQPDPVNPEGPEIEVTTEEYISVAPTTNYKLDFAYTITITATQVD